VRKLILFFILFLGIFTACEHSNNPVVAEAFHQKLFWSEVVDHIPYNTSTEDSLFFIEKYVEEWVLYQTLLAKAKNSLSQNEQNFSSQIAQYKNKLLIDKYLQKTSENSNRFIVSNQELTDFLNKTITEEIPEYRDMVKLNYIKLSNPSKLYKKIKDLFFQEQDRIKALRELELICADTIEYYLDDDHWFYTDFIESELPFSFSNKINTEPHTKFDFVQDGNRYLVLILDKKQQFQNKNRIEDRKMAEALLQQQKRADFLNNLQDSLVKKAISEKNVILYPIPF